MTTNRPVLNSDETFLRKNLDDFDSGKDFDSDVIPTWTNTFFGTTHRNFTEQWNNVKTRWHRNYGYLFSSNDSIQSSNPENTFQNELYLSDERDFYDNISEASAITKEKAFNRRRRYVCVGVTIAIVLVLLACIISAVLIEVIFVPPRNDLAVQARLSMRIINRNYTEELSNKSSESFQLFQKELCSSVQRKVNEDTSCIIDSVKNGSLIVDIRLFTTSTRNAEAFGVTVIVIIKGDTQDGSSYSIGVFLISEIKSESSNLVVQETIPPTAIIYNKDETTFPSSTLITTSTVTSSSSLQPSSVEISSSHSALQLESRSTEMSPGLMESRSSESSIITSLLSLAETSSKMSESSSNEESLLESSYSESPHSSQQPSPSLTETSSSTLQLERRSTDISSGLLESRPSESSVRTSLLSLVETSSKMLEPSSNLESFLESSSSESDASLIVSESFVSTLLPNPPETTPEMIKSSSTGSSTTFSESPNSSPQPNLSETSSTMLKSSYTATYLSPSEFSSSESTFGIPQSSSKEEFSTVLESSAADTSPVVFEASSSSNEASSTMLESSSPDTPSLMLESRSNKASDSTLQPHSTELPSSTETSLSPLETSSSETSFNTPRSNDELSTRLESSSALISSFMLEPDSSGISSSTLQPSSNEAFTVVPESSSADSDTPPIMLESGSSEASYSSLQTRSAGALSSVLVSSSDEISSISLVTSSRETSISTPQSSSKLETSSSESSFSAPESSSNEASSILTESSFGTPQPTSTEALSTMLESSPTVISPIALESSSWVITSSAPQLSSNEGFSTILESWEVSYSLPRTRSMEASSSILVSTFAETSSNLFESSSIDSFTISLQTSEESSDSLASISDEFDFGVSVTYSSTLESMSNTVLSSTQLPIPSLSLPYTLQPSSNEIQYSTLVISPTEVTSGTSTEALTGSLESDFIEVSSSILSPLSSMLVPSSNTLTSSITEPSTTDMLISTAEIKPSAFSTESPITTAELASSLIATTLGMQTSESSVNVIATTEISSVISTSEIAVTPSPSLSPSSTQDIEMSSTFIPVITVRDTLIYQNEDNLTLGCNITNTENFTQIIFDVNGVEAGMITRDQTEIEPQWTFRNESNSDKQIYLMTLEEPNCTHSGNYTCSIGGDWGVVQQTATIEVRVAPGEPVIAFPDQIVENRILRQNITCSVDAGIPASMVTWSVEFQDGQQFQNFNFNPTEKTNSSESCTNKHVSSFISTFNISWHNSSLCCNVDQGSRRTSTCKHLFVVPSDYCNNRTDGIYDHPYDDCYLYVSCGGGTVYISNCGKSGAFCFDEQAKSCSRAAPTTTIDPSQASDPYSCNGKINFSYIPVRGSCTEYMRCVNSDQFPGVCPGTTYFYDTEPDQTCTNDISQAYCTLNNNK
ncbi:uncharacterized protein LOC126819291 [Patella vulgata]|uniref:uncharacterized protein LOC126819291 n=1 Tax=Patella vulgata TaxID=6465 RepID=UPI0021803429|nr:uncharacterized protein LOC126819291 [Patella vulgata]